MANVGTNGYYWSSSSRLAGDNNAGNLNFNSGNVNPLNWNNRANGFSVRCVQHLRGIVSDACAPANYPIKNAPLTLNGGGYGFCQCGR